MATIGIFDSGVGGLSVYREIRKLLPGDRCIYFSDNAYCPYGEKDPEFILDRAREITDFLLFKGADIIVIACNTATAAAIADLREEYSHSPERIKTITGGRQDHVKFIGMEPAIKPAAECTRTGVVGVLATAGTLSGSKYLDHKEKFEGDVRIIEHVGQGFVELVENGEIAGTHAEEVVSCSLKPLLDAGADIIVLGCTHYPFLKDTIQKIAGPGVKVIDPAPAVARHLVKVMDEEGIVHSSPDSKAVSDPVILKTSGPRDALDRTFALIRAPHDL